MVHICRSNFLKGSQNALPALFCCCLEQISARILCISSNFSAPANVREEAFQTVRLDCAQRICFGTDCRPGKLFSAAKCCSRAHTGALETKERIRKF